MARMLGRIWTGGHYCNGSPEDRKRVKRQEQRGWLRAEGWLPHVAYRSCPACAAGNCDDCKGPPCGCYRRQCDAAAAAEGD